MKIGTPLAWASVVVGMSVSAAWAGTVKPLPQHPPDDGMVQTATAGLSEALRGDGGFVLLTLAGRAVKWGDGGIGSGAAVRYAFVTSETERPGAVNCRTLVPIGDRLERSQLRQADFEAEVRRAMDDWSAQANIRFEPADNPASADLLIGGKKNPRGIAYADVQRGRGGRNLARISSAAVCFNLELAWEVRFDGDPATPNVRYVAAHELGHAFGLDHAWGSDKLMRFQYEERFYLPQKGDIAGAAFLYGPRPAGLALIGPAAIAR